MLLLMLATVTGGANRLQERYLQSYLSGEGHSQYLQHAVLDSS